MGPFVISNILLWFENRIHFWENVWAKQEPTGRWTSHPSAIEVKNDFQEI